MGRITIGLIIIAVLALVVSLYYKEGGLPVNSKDTSAKIFVVEKGEGVNQIVKKLHNENLIRNRIVFYLLIKNLGLDHKLQAGDFRLSPAMSAQEIAKNLTRGTLDTWITIVEGLRKEEIAQIVNREFDIPESEFIGQSDEGYLFPDTYLIPKDATAGAILTIFNHNFYKRYDSNLQQRARTKGLSDHEVITLASLVEKEARHDADRTQVASIILKRWKRGWPLQIDATVQYALGYQPTQKTWWKKNLTIDDLAINSPYNTYKHPGVPPGPICNPGLASIKAVINADVNTPYWYYISSKDGSKMYYAKTQQEHDANVNKYLR